MIAVQRVTAASQWALAYGQLERMVHAGDPWAVPLLPGQVNSALDDRHPFFGYGRGCRFLAMDGERPLARAAAYINPHARDSLGQRIGYIGHFESLPEATAARQVLDAAVDWLGQQGVTRAVGPMDFSTWHRYRLVTGGHSAPPFLLEPHNPPYYPELFTACGFTAEQRYCSHWASDVQTLVAKGAAAGARLRCEGYSLRPLNLSHLDDELRLLHPLSLRIFAANRYFTPCPLAEFRALYAGASRLLPPGFAWIANAPDGQPAGFLVALPDVSAALRAAGGRGGIMGAARFWLAKRRADTNILKTIGVAPEHCGKGLARWMVGVQQQRALRHGLTRAIHALMIVDNPSLHLASGGTEPLRRYTLYSRTTGAPGTCP